LAPKPPVDKTFRVFDPDQGLLLPPSLDDWLPTGTRQIGTTPPPPRTA
jgi:hypothetical protein